MWSDLTLDPSFKVKPGWPNLKMLITHLLLVVQVLDGKPTYRKSWLGILQGQKRIAKLKSAHNWLITGRTGLGWQTNL